MIRFPYLKGVIETQRLILRRPENADLSLVRAFAAADNKALYPNMGYCRETETLRLQWFIDVYSGGAKSNRMGMCLYEKDGGDIIGKITVWRDENHKLRCSPFLLPSKRGQGYMQEALSNLWRQLGKEAGLSELYAEFMPQADGLKSREFNQQVSIKLFKRLGFQLTGNRQSDPADPSHPYEILAYGCKLQDLVLYGALNQNGL